MEKRKAILVLIEKIKKSEWRAPGLRGDLLTSWRKL